MDVATINVRPTEARALWLEYRRAVRVEVDARRKAEDVEVMRAYRAIAQGARVLDVKAVVARAGLDARFYPRFAWANATARVVRLNLRPDGAASFASRMDDQQWRTRRAKTHALDLAAGSFPAWNWSTRPQHWSSQVDAAVPAVPPHLRPASLDGFAILWEPTWTPAPPRDPLLVRMCGRTLAVIVGAWDLTELERAVMAGRD